MSIYFLHFLNAFLPVSLFVFFFARGEKFYRTLILMLAGATFGYFGYKISLTIQGLSIDFCTVLDVCTEI